jgi:hypothetical protein
MLDIEPLETISKWYSRSRARGPYTEPSARIRATEILVRKFSFRFQTKKIGKMPKVQSAAVTIVV